ncbi:NIPSNAP family protein [Opitutia bacterium ISCC 51]|nr:NIPSNAP family protein [Opitutae bacterium ISCC 51]QXD29290.1 NIPSNAP family protein [Opitutae bacterium ISCC 52]
MNRRTFITTAAVAGASTSTLLQGAGHKSQQAGYLELIRFVVRNRPAVRTLEKYLGDTVIPGLNKLGCNPIGVFKPKHGSHGADVYMLVPHKDMDSFSTAWKKLSATDAFKAASDTTIEGQLYERMETTLMSCFSHMPELEIPKAVKGVDGRIFEMRIYEAHNRMKSDLKVEMFNEGGEIEIFRDVGLHPVFFGHTMAGPLMPNLIYMLAFKDIAEREANWKKFSSDPAWVKLRQNKRYAGTVSNITDIIMTASSVSQI